jgi:hypothetical protein
MKMNTNLIARFPATSANFHATIFKTGVSSLAYLLKTSSQEIAMSSSANLKLRVTSAASAIVASCSAVPALASQGPGGGMGTAGHFTQLAMAVLVYGMSALVIGDGLIGALRRR